MCVMDVKAEHPAHEIAQAIFHNERTVAGDVKMWLSLLEARGEPELLAKAEAALKLMNAAEELLGTCFTTECRLGLAKEAAAREAHQHELKAA